MLIKVYLDLVFLLNFGFDLILLLVVSITLKRNSKMYRLLLGALFGSLSLLFLFLDINSIELFILKFLISIVMLLISFGYRDIKYFMNNFLYLYLVSIILGGFLYYLNNLFYYKNNGMIFINKGFSINYLVLIIISPIILFLYIRNNKLIRNNYNNYYLLKIYLDSENVIEATGFLDTGNKLKDPYSNKGIILINKKYVPNGIRSPILIPYNTLNNHGLLKCMKGEKILINDKVNTNFLVGISDQEFFMDGIDCILSNKILEELR